MTQPVPTSPTGPPPPFPPVASSSLSASSTTPAAATPIPIRPSHNDLNDAQNISNILKSSIHNGSSSTISSTNHNNNHSNEKRLFGDDQLFIALTKPNHKEDAVKESDEKLHHRSRRKQKVAALTSSPPTAIVSVKQNQHKHTNGLNNSTDKILNNCLGLLNGDDGYDDEQIEKWRKENIETRSMAFKEIRKLGRDYRGLYEQLERVKGTFDMRFGFIQMCIDEASRFRRKHMVSCIQEWWDLQCDEKNPKPANSVKA